MISLAKVGTRQEVLTALEEVKGTEKSDNNFWPDVKAFVVKQVGAVPENKNVAVEIKARTMAGGNWHLEIFVQPREIAAPAES